MATDKSTIAKAYAEALKRLRKNHDSEFHQLLKTVYTEYGIDIAKRRSHQQVLSDQIAAAKRLLMEHDQPEA